MIINKAWEGSTNQQVTRGNKKWLISTLIEKSKDFEVFDYNIEHLDLSNSVWEPMEVMYQFIQHVKMCEDADIECPIILNEDNSVLDGWHRMIKAFMQGDKTIKAVKFKDQPDGYFTE